ncbi:2-succinylbenzoate--CoA ligase [Pseudoalteromonas holothuriae]|uniref:2-succinylbenzoate--CoA ligase n=1 Tax=Pseudoalteromonas holothuriae TaxID=2963714 RepID=A0ABN8UQY3_9GAMM|nr:AMP-binding protein [Pseudoalteromonas sp. CIP111951]CAH9067309.1 2-succinylbenzoate--CoA ligase [Pseudoalteromonas sp. CIP111951]
MNKHHIVFGELNYATARLILTLVTDQLSERISIIIRQSSDEVACKNVVFKCLNEIATKNNVLLSTTELEKLTVYNHDCNTGANDALVEIEQRLTSLGIYHHETVRWEVETQVKCSASTQSYAKILKYLPRDEEQRSVQQIDIANILGPVGHYQDELDTPLNRFIFSLLEYSEEVKGRTVKVHIPKDIELEFLPFECYLDEILANEVCVKIAKDTVNISAQKLVTKIASVLALDLEFVNDALEQDLDLIEFLEREELTLSTSKDTLKTEENTDSFLSSLCMQASEAKTWKEDINVDAILFAHEKKHTESLNFADKLLEIARTIKQDKVAIHHALGDMKYGDFEHSIKNAVSNVVNLDIKPGTRVGVISNDSTHFTIAVLSLMYSGCTAIIINPLLKAETIAQAIRSAQVDIVFGDDDFFELASESEHLPTGLISLFANIREVAPICDGADDKGVTHWAPARTRPFDYAIGMFSSGTTGIPKLILHRHQDFVVAAERYAAQVLNINSSDRALSVSRMSFAFGLHNCFNALYNSATAILSPPTLSIDEIVESIKLYKPTIFYAVPTVYQFLLTHENISANDFITVRCFVSAGDRMPIELNRKWQAKFNAVILDSLGSTEAFSTYLTNIPGSNRALGDTGKIVPGFDAKILNGRGIICSHGDIGTLWLKGPTLPSRYESNNAETEARFKDGWYCTNDMFKCDKDGYFRYIGRADDVIKVSGQWVSPQDIEDVLLGHPDVVEIAVVAVGDHETTTRPKAFVVTKRQDYEQLTKELKEYAKQNLERWKYPHLFQYAKSLPKTVTGKLQRYRLKGVVNELVL